MFRLSQNIKYIIIKYIISALTLWALTQFGVKYLLCRSHVTLPSLCSVTVISGGGVSCHVSCPCSTFLELYRTRCLQMGSLLQVKHKMHTASARSHSIMNLSTQVMLNLQSWLCGSVHVTLCCLPLTVLLF